MAQAERDEQGFRNLGSVSQYPDLQAIAGAIFSRAMYFSLPDGTRLRTKLFKASLFAVEHDGLRYIEQNPNTRSAYADRAKSGARIAWVIRIYKRVDNNWTPCNEWLGRVEDGIVWRK